MTPNETFLLNMRDAAKAANHPFPEYAACETALETASNQASLPPQSNFGRNGAYLQGNNCFGNMQRAKPVYQTLSLKDFQIINGKRIDKVENYIKFPDVQTAFAFRLQTLQQYPAIYRDALNSATGEDFIRNVSAQWKEVDGPEDQSEYIYAFMDGFFQFVKARWSTAPYRASTVIEIYNQHKAIFATPVMPTTVIA